LIKTQKTLFTVYFLTQIDETQLDKQIKRTQITKATGITIATICFCFGAGSVDMDKKDF
jgi:hypothetical protein